MNLKNKPYRWKIGALAVAVLLLLLPVGLALNFYLPSQRVVRVLNPDVYFQNRGGKNAQAMSGVYQVFAEDPDTRKQRVYHNEDTGWGFPWYFKFNSADIQSAVTSIAADAGKDENYAVITSYGWRINMLSMFPNVTSIRKVPKDYAPVPWFNIVFFSVVAFVIGWIAFLVRRWRRARVAPPAAVNRVAS